MAQRMFFYFFKVDGGSPGINGAIHVIAPNVKYAMQEAQQQVDNFNDH